jgi:hypothetical protein
VDRCGSETLCRALAVLKCPDTTFRRNGKIGTVMVRDVTCSSYRISWKVRVNKARTYDIFSLRYWYPISFVYASLQAFVEVIKHRILLERSN